MRIIITLNHSNQR